MNIQDFKPMADVWIWLWPIAYLLVTGAARSASSIVLAVASKVDDEKLREAYTRTAQNLINARWYHPTQIFTRVFCSGYFYIAIIALFIVTRA